MDDVSFDVIRGQINLLAGLRSELGLTHAIIAHDPSLIRHVANRVAVMYLGNLVELAAATTLPGEHHSGGLTTGRGTGRRVRRWRRWLR